MKINSVKVHNYRSIKDDTFDCDDYTIIIGPNNHGKSNLMRAIRAVLDTESLEPEDFYKGATEAWIEIAFTGLNEKEQTDLKKYLLAPTFDQIRVKANWEKGAGKTKVTLNGYVNWPSHPFFKQMLNATGGDQADELAELVRKSPIASMYAGKKKIAFKDVMESVARYLDENPTEPTEPLLDTWNKFQGLVTNASSKLPSLYFVPAVREVDAEMKLKSTSLFGRIFFDIISSNLEGDTELEALQAALKNAFEELKAEKSALGKIGRLIADEMPLGWGTELSMRVHVEPPTLDELYEQCLSLLVNDGVESHIGDKGHGLQRAMLFAMTKAWAKAINRKEGDTTLPSMVLAIEEPELYLHPHSQSAFLESIKQLAAQADFQVIACTHSPLFVELEEYQKILIVEKCPNDGTQSRQVRGDIFTDKAATKQMFNMGYWLNPDRSRLFFARKVILVEGHTEAAVIPLIANKLNVFDYQVSVIDCGGKFNLQDYITLCSAFKLPYHVIHDEDPVAALVAGNDKRQSDKDKQQSQQRTFTENPKILAAAGNDPSLISMARPDMEGLLGVSGGSSKLSSKPMKAIEFINGKTAEELEANHAALCAVVRAAYAGQATPVIQPAAAA